MRLLTGDHYFHGWFQGRVRFHIHQAPFMSEKLRRHLVEPSQIWLLKNHFLLLKDRRLGFYQGRCPDGTGGQGRAWCILSAPTAVRSSSTSRDLQGDLWPQARPWCDEGPRGLNLPLLQLMHPEQGDGKQTREERRGHEASHSKGKSTWVYQGSQTPQIKPDWGQQRKDKRRNCFNMAVLLAFKYHWWNNFSTGI